MSGFVHKEKKYPEQFKLYVPIESRSIVAEAKEIATREGESLSQKFVKYCEDYVRVHGEGNPQMLITKFSQKQLVEKSCDYPGCHEIAQYVDFPHPPGKPKVYYCLVHHKHALENQLLFAKRSKLL